MRAENLKHVYPYKQRWDKIAKTKDRNRCWLKALIREALQKDLCRPVAVTHAGPRNHFWYPSSGLGSRPKGLKGVININRGPTIDPRRGTVPGLIPAEGFIRSSSFEGNRLLKMPLTPVIGSIYIYIYFLPIPLSTGIDPPRGPSACSADFILLLSRPSTENRSMTRLGKFLQSLPFHLIRISDNEFSKDVTISLAS